MSFEEYLMYIKHMSIEDFEQSSLEAKMYLENEYEIAYGI